MQELRLVAVSEDGTRLILATEGRETRFTLPIDDRLRAAARGQFSRLGQDEIEVESPLRPKEIQARIRAGESAEEIAEISGLPLERVRWFEGPVLQEREFVAQQAGRVPVRRSGDSTPGRPLADVVGERLRRRGVDPEDAEWDSRKRDDGTWLVSVAFSMDGRRYCAEWTYDSRRRHVGPADDEANRLSSPDIDENGNGELAKVRQFVPRLAPAPPPRDDGDERAGGAHAAGRASRRADEVEQKPWERPTLEPQEPAAEQEEAALPPAAHTYSAPTPPAAVTRPAPAPPAEPDEPAASREPAASQEAPAEPSRSRRSSAARGASTKRRTEAEEPQPQERPEADEREDTEPAADTEPQQQQPEEAPTAVGNARPSRGKKSAGRGKRASVPSWDEIMFGARRQD